MKKMLFTKLILLCASLLFFASCSNMIDSAERAALEGEKTSASEQSAGKKVTFTGSVCVAGALPECFRQTELASPSHNSASRSALPSFTIGTNYFYYVIASQKDGNGSVRINSIDNAEAFSLSSGVTFDLELSFGSWEIECGICDRVSPDFLMSDTYPFTISDTNPSINHTFYPKPSQKGSGTVALQISYESGMVDSITAKCGNDSWSVTTSGTQATIEKSSINSGAYDLSIYFFKNDDQGNPLPVYATNQTINVFDNMTTNTWVSDGSGLINESGVFNLTSDLISQFARTTFYVGQTTAATNMEFTASDRDGSGSPYKPLKTLKKAIEIIKLLNAESSEYRVFVCEDQDLSGLTESLSLVPDDKAINLTIQGFDPQNSERQFILSGYNESSQKSQFDGAFIKIAGKSNTDTIVTLRNLSIYGHKNTLSLSNGGGLLCSKAKVSLENVDIRDNECGEKGGGIFATSSSIVTIKDSYIQGNKATNTDGAFGAGIALMAGATVYIEGNTHILENESAKDGGGIGVSDTGSNKLYINDGHIYANTAVNGGGVYNGRELYFSAGGISQNIATALGGGVYSSGSMFMYGSAVIGDSAKTTAATDLVHSNKAGAKGGGIYSTGNLYLGYSSWTSESSNTPQELTGGVFYNFSPDVGGIHQYADNNSYLFKMKSGSVSYNAGRGIYVGKCTFTMSGGTVKGNTAIKGSDSNTEYQLNGAGLYAGTGATITVSGGTITENHAEENGGGLYTAQNDSIIILEDGTISSNTVDSNGNGIAIANGYLKMKGNASVDSNNDVFLASEKYIEITDALTATSSVATLIIDEYTVGRRLLFTEADSGVTLANEVGKFVLTQNAAEPETVWEISRQGMLIKELDAEDLNSTSYDIIEKIKVTSATGMTKLIELADSTNAKNFEGKTITLAADVVLSAGQNFDTPFKGTFDGNGKTISGMSEVPALFSQVYKATVKDLTVEGSSTKAGIASSMTDGLIEGCISRVNVNSTGSNCGGIVGIIHNSDTVTNTTSPTVRNCINEGTIKSGSGSFGGIAGSENSAYSIIDSCVNKGTVEYTGSGSIIGGIVGSAFGVVRNCINTGNVIGGSGTQVGGITGVERHHSNTTSRYGVYNCANLAPVSGKYQVGGIAGVYDIQATSLNYSATIKNCFNAGSVSITDNTKTSVGGIVGEFLLGGSGSCILASNYYKTGTATSGIGADNGETVEAPRAMVPSIYQMNEWVNANNSGNIYKTWTSKVVDSVTLPIPDVGYEW